MGHEQCASCHSKAGMKPMLTATSTTADCQGCHNPMAIENPALLAGKPSVPAHVISGEYKDIKFSHSSHFQHRAQFDMNCTSCHKDMAQSNSLANLDLPKMSDCASCHSQKLAANRRMDSCSTCHVNKETGIALASYSRLLKPAFHNESFRVTHRVEASRQAQTVTCAIPPYLPLPRHSSAAKSATKP